MEKNNNKKYTMQDIADAVGVTKTTVSYVLNNKKGSRISDETKERILHVANLYNYTPNFAAKYLASNISDIVGIVFGKTDSGLINSINMELIKSLIGKLEQRNEKLVILSLDSENLKRSLTYPFDVVIAVDLSENEISKISRFTFAPLLLVDTMTKDPLFKKITGGFSGIAKDISRENIRKVMVPYYNCTLYSEKIIHEFENLEVAFIHNINDIALQLKGVDDSENIFVFNKYIYDCVHNIFGHSKVTGYTENLEIKSDKIVELVDKLKSKQECQEKLFEYALYKIEENR